jgi:hypothetical protein
VIRQNFHGFEPMQQFHGAGVDERPGQITIQRDAAELRAVAPPIGTHILDRPVRVPRLLVVGGNSRGKKRVPNCGAAVQQTYCGHVGSWRYQACS